MSDLQAIAAELRQQSEQGTWHEALIPHLAGTIEVCHHPDAAPTDGSVSAEALTDMMRGEHLRAIMPDERQVAEEITVDGDAITAVQRLQGTLVDGTMIDIPLTQKFTFSGGKLVGIDHYTDPADTKVLMEKAAALMAQAQQPSS
jgi:hypothetical protein